jgi:plasmid stabilization system protein ParE
MREVKYAPEAREELNSTIAWCQQHRASGFARQLLGTLSTAIHEIAERPLAWPVSKLEQRLRVRQLRRIRYSVFYRVTSDAITIVAIAHMSQRPGYWLDRRW